MHEGRRARALPVPLEWDRAVRAWRSALRASGRSETTVRTRVDHVRHFAGEVAPVGPWAVTLDDLVEWLSGKGWAVETRRSHRSTFRAFYRWAVDTGRTGDDPAVLLPKVTPSAPAPHPVTENAYRFAVLTAGARERLMLRLAGEIGLRRAEVAQVHTRDLIDRPTGWSLIVHGKGNRDRVVPLPDSLAGELRSLPPGWAFPGDDHGHLSPRWVGTLVSRLLPAGVTMHALRHRFGTRAYAIDRDVFAVQQLLGHASPATTRRYVQVADDDMRRLVDLVAGEGSRVAAG